MQIGEVLTMAEYIEREAISEEIRKYYSKNPPNFSYGEGFDRGLDRAQRWTDVTAIALWHEQEQMMDMGG